MEQLSVWVGAGVVTAGVSAALLAGAGAATADTGSGAESGASASSGSTASAPPGRGASPKPTHDTSPVLKTKTPRKPKSKPEPEPTAKENQQQATETPAASHPASEPADDAPSGSAHSDGDEPVSAETTFGTRAERPSKHRTVTPVAPRQTPLAPRTSPPAPPADQKPEPAQVADATPARSPTTELTAKRLVAQDVSTITGAPASVPRAPLAAPARVGVVQGVIRAVVNVASLVFDTVQAVEALVTGPPVLPPGSTVTVRNSTISLGNGQRVAANWYYPKGDAVPEHMILLQHGFFALGPMYSYTAANLAQHTQSIVVTPTLSSNPLAGDSFWLGGTGMSKVIADLFEGDRAALTQSAVDAGFAKRYGVEAKLPDEFALAGHSLGANLVSGAAGNLAEDCRGDGCAADHLVGVILFDGVPVGSTLPEALQKLNAYAATPDGHYIPVREIGAPLNLFNSPSNVNADLTKYRNGHYNGVVLDGGTHMDSMRGGNPLIQFVAYLVAGFPQPQNPPAVDQLSAQWLGQWFAGDPYVGDGTLAPGSTIAIGAARGVVIGDPPVARLGRSVTFEPTTPTTIPTASPALASLAA